MSLEAKKNGIPNLTAHFATSSLTPPSDPSNKEQVDIDWENMGFGLIPTDYMYISKCAKDGSFDQGKLIPYGNLEISPAAGVLNYGQGIYEGTKAFRREKGGIFLFRPDQNAIRMQISAERLCMPFPSIDQFLDAVKQIVMANKRWIPPPGKGSLYIRPILFGSGPVLGLAPAPHYTFLIYASPVGNYFKVRPDTQEGVAPLNIYIEEEFHRSSRGGSGGVKSITNYAPVMKPLLRAKGKGFSDVLYLDSTHNRYVEEVSSCNLFMVKGDVVLTPPAGVTILSGITRKSIIDIARDLGYKVEERVVDVEELCNADEAFCTGTAVGIAPVGSITYKEKRILYKLGSGTVGQKLASTLLEIQRGEIGDKMEWVVEIEKPN
ncbi:unnamed protein product [Cuscuta epithymum]|uniref:Branched-chain-amino-acid aminotransferase n=1 Tax=Cuscuta epithymum TaxID=186058 RepID=A0AAV0C316_9ASTE|nr:unnamed protein product [Cuscuta epithymum]